MAKVSVVVPIYNAEKTLKKCIESILDQTLQDIELILVNDGSVDISLEICKGFEKQDSRIRVIDKNNEGSIKTRRKGVECSNAEYVMFVDADDWIEKKTVETLYNESIINSADVTVCNSYKVLSDKAFIKRKNKSIYFLRDRLYEGEDIKRELVVAYFYGHPFPAFLVAKLYKRDLLINSGRYLEKIHFFGEDLFYNLEILLKIERLKIIDKPLYYYRAGGFTSKYMDYMFEDAVNGYELQKRVIEEYYTDSLEEQYKGVSIMLLNTLKTCLCNCFCSDFDKHRIKEMISEYVQNKSIKEALENAAVKKYFGHQYLSSIRYKDIQYLFRLGKSMYIRRKLRQLVLGIIYRFKIA